ncbi:MAG TPA: hypothetical protein VGG81_08000, partial [Edaphobacter sp.]
RDQRTGCGGPLVSIWQIILASTKDRASMARSFAFSQSVFRSRAVAIAGNQIFTMAPANVCLKALTENCHPDRSAAKWRDLLF